MGTATVPTPAVETVEKSYSYFDGTTLESKSETIKVEFAPPATLADAMARIDSDQEIVLKALTSYLRRAVLSEAKRSVLSKGVSKKIVLGVLRPFRALPPWSDMKDRGEQTKALLELLRGNPAILEAIKSANAASPADDDDDEENEN